MEAPNGTVSEEGDRSRSSSAVIFLGTGCSSAVPNATCLIQPSDPPCHVCSSSLSLPPDRSPNHRCNTSLLIDYFRESEHSYIIIDVGKTFRDQVLRWFTFHRIPRVDCVFPVSCSLHLLADAAPMSDSWGHVLRCVLTRGSSFSSCMVFAGCT